jgi:lipopolysaccharide export system protein LptA
MRALKFPELTSPAIGEGETALRHKPRRILIVLSFLVPLVAWLAGVPTQGAAQAHQVPPDSPPPSGEVTAPDGAMAQPAATAGAIPAVASVGPASAAPSAAAQQGNQGSKPASASGDKTGSSASNAPFTPFGGNQKGPINIQSDGLNLDYKNNWVLFHGHVHAVQGGGELTSDTLRVKYGKDFSDMQMMYADGSVRISQGTRYSTSDHAVLDQAVHTVTLTGNPVVHDGSDSVVGQKIVVNLVTGKSDVTGGAKAWFFPRDSKSPNNEAAANGTAQ